MLYASSKDRFKRELDLNYEIQASDPTEIQATKSAEISNEGFKYISKAGK